MMRKNIAAMCVAIAAWFWVSGNSASSESSADYVCRRDRYLQVDEEYRLRLEEQQILRKIDDLQLELKEKHRKLENERRKLDEIRHRLLCIRDKLTY